jgi:hypothetical protein
MRSCRSPAFLLNEGAAKKRNVDGTKYKRNRHEKPESGGGGDRAALHNSGTGERSDSSSSSSCQSSRGRDGDDDEDDHDDDGEAEDYAGHRDVVDLVNSGSD